MRVTSSRRRVGVTVGQVHGDVDGEGLLFKGFAPVKGTPNVSVCDDILDSPMLPTLWTQFGDVSSLL